MLIALTPPAPLPVRIALQRFVEALGRIGMAGSGEGIACAASTRELLRDLREILVRVQEVAVSHRRAWRTADFGARADISRIVRRADAIIASGQWLVVVLGALDSGDTEGAEAMVYEALTALTER